MASRSSFFVTCAPGLEPLLHAELKALRLSKLERQVGGVYFEGDLRDAWRVNLWSRCGVRVLMRVARFSCAEEEALYQSVREVDWSRFLEPEGRLVVDAHSNESHLDHTRYIEQRVKDAVVDQFRERFGARPSVDREEADLGLYAHLYRDRCTLLADTSGRSLHLRGWRQAQGKAPLAETIAAALVALSGWDQRSPLLDPFCGSGTVLIEAALAAMNVAPGTLGGDFGFERWRGHDARAFEAERKRACAAGRARGKGTLLGTDIEKERVDDARRNAEAAGVGDWVRFEVADAREFAPRAGWNGWIVSNLPYGQRIGADVGELYRAFGKRLSTCVGYHAALLTLDDDQATEALGLRNAAVTQVINGGLECRVSTALIGA